jgi:hypothetical protein
MNILDIIPESEVISTIKSEFNKKLTLYKITNFQFVKKYNMSWETFLNKNIVKEKSYIWEVEKDSMEWEHANEGIKNIESKLKLLK